MLTKTEGRDHQNKVIGLQITLEMLNGGPRIESARVE